MKYHPFWVCLLVITYLFGCKPSVTKNTVITIAQGQMPDLTNDRSGNLHLVFGSGDSILYVSSEDGKAFSAPVLIARLQHLAASHSRGPQIAVTESGVTVTAGNAAGDIFSYIKTSSGNWTPGARVNDADTTAKEGLMALSGDGNLLYAVWLDLRDMHNKIFGASSTDGGKSWSPNRLVYASPDTTVCECCKPSVYVKGNAVNVMFRNWLNGNRDLYLIQSHDAGNSFGQAQKMGTGSWALNGCPMDGGGLVMNSDNNIETVWRRQGKIYAAEPGKPEVAIGEGKGCTLTSVNNKNIYTWVEKGEVVCLLPGSGKKILGKGNFPVIKPVSDKQVMCVWENEEQIKAAVISL